MLRDSQKESCTLLLRFDEALNNENRSTMPDFEAKNVWCIWNRFKVLIFKISYLEKKNQSF